MPFFSVIIPLYNKETYIKETLLSVVDQSFKDFEIIVVDDGSTDNSVDIVKNLKLDNVTLIIQENKGVASARNKGISFAKGSYIALIDADDTWYNNHLEELKKQIELFPNAGLYCNNYEVLYNKITKRSAVFNLGSKSEPFIVTDYFGSSTTNSVAWTSAVAFSKTMFKTIGGFKEELTTYEDLDLWIRLALKYEVSFNPKITMTYKLFIEDSLTTNEDNSHKEQFLNSYLNEEQGNPSLKQYFDINRYALAIKAKLANDKELFRRLLNQVDRKNLNSKQRLLLKLPASLLSLLKKVQQQLIKKNIYLTAFK